MVSVQHKDLLIPHELPGDIRLFTYQISIQESDYMCIVQTFDLHSYKQYKDYYILIMFDSQLYLCKCNYLTGKWTQDCIYMWGYSTNKGNNLIGLVTEFKKNINKYLS